MLADRLKKLRLYHTPTRSEEQSVGLTKNLKRR